jgi:hypothetical protein
VSQAVSFETATEPSSAWEDGSSTPAAHTQEPVAHTTGRHVRLQRRPDVSVATVQCFVGGAAKSTATSTPCSTRTERPRQAKPILMRSSRALHVSRVDKADPCSMTRPIRCSVRHSKSRSVAPAAMRSTRSWGVDRGGTGRVQDRLMFNERGEQVEESPLTLVEILSPNHGATPWGRASCPPPSAHRSSVAHCSANWRVWTVTP